MQPTTFGLALLPLSLIFAAQPVRLLQLTFVAAVFEAAAALVIGGLGLQPALVPGLLFLAFVLLQYLLGMRYPGERLVFWTMTPLLLLLGYAVFSIAVLPDAFAGKILVVPQKPDPLGATLTPLQYAPGNVNQTLYLAINVGAATIAALFLTRAALPYRKVINAYLLSGYLVVGLSAWQFLSRTAGLPFPDDVLYSNPGWAILNQNIGAVPRIRASFSEPAALAVYLSGVCLCCLRLTLDGHRAMRPGLLLALAVVVLLLSTSTTGFAFLAVALPVFMVAAYLRGGRAMRVRLRRVVLFLGLGGALVVGPAALLRPDLLDPINAVLEGTVSKQDSESYNDRTAVDQAALATVTQTYGLGVGWGSFRSSSLVPGLLANAGLPGVVLLAWFALRVVRLSSRCPVTAAQPGGQALITGFSAAVLGQLAAALMSAPVITSLAFFLQLGCLIGAVVRTRVEAQRARTVPAGLGVLGAARSWVG